MRSFDFTLPTDENGYFHHSTEYDAPTPFPLRVTLEVTLNQPLDIKAEGRLDIDPVRGGRGNQARDFLVESGEATSLGTWRLDGGDNLIVLFGRTDPPRPNDTLVVTVSASL